MHFLCMFNFSSLDCFGLKKFDYLNSVPFKLTNRSYTKINQTNPFKYNQSTVAFVSCREQNKQYELVSFTILFCLVTKLNHKPYFLIRPLGSEFVKDQVALEKQGLTHPSKRHQVSTPLPPLADCHDHFFKMLIFIYKYVYIMYWAVLVCYGNLNIESRLPKPAPKPIFQKN